LRRLSRQVLRADRKAATTDYVVHADHVLATFRTQHEAIEWAKRSGHPPHVARVVNDKKRTTSEPYKLSFWRSLAEGPSASTKT
jgi:hypothetical protein